MIALVAAVFIGLLAYSDIKITTRALLSMEAISVTLIIMLMVVIFAKLIGGDAPGHGDISSDVFSAAGGRRTGGVRARRRARVPLVRRVRGRRGAG